MGDIKTQLVALTEADLELEKRRLIQSFLR